MNLLLMMFFVSQFAVFILALSIHEAAHAFASNKLGDPTAKMLGRLTLNPVPHVDPIGTLLLPLIAFFTGFAVIGWAKPVPVNTFNLRDPKLDHAFIALAGPVSNMVQAFIFTGIMWLIEPIGQSLVMSQTSTGLLYYAKLLLYMLCSAGIIVNLLLAVFNLIPIPPLDGGWILGGVLPDEFSAMLQSIGQFGFVIIWILLYMGFFSMILLPVINAFSGALLPQWGAMIFKGFWIG